MAEFALDDVAPDYITDLQHLVASYPPGERDDKTPSRKRAPTAKPYALQTHTPTPAA